MPLWPNAVVGHRGWANDYLPLQRPVDQGRSATHDHHFFCLSTICEYLVEEQLHGLEGAPVGLLVVGGPFTVVIA